MTCNTLREEMLSLDRQVPRYTSYPTAPHFKPTPDADCYSRALKALPEGEALSLYIHVPYCAKMCWYCGCHTKVTRKYAPIAGYVQALLSEIKMVGAELPTKMTVKHVHFGGGSPSLLSAEDFAAIMTELKAHFTFEKTAEVALELDPRSIDASKVEAYAAHGVNRASLGVQDFDDTVLKAVNREQPFALSEKAMALLRKANITDINFDLLYGLPHQTPKSMRQTIGKTLTLQPERIALFGYAHVPWMKKHMRLINENALPTKELRLNLFELAQKMLLDAGYTSIGIDHFVKPQNPMAKAFKNKTLQRNFQGYTVDGCKTLIGFGASAIGQTHNAFFQNEVNTGLYQTKVNNNQLATVKTATLKPKDHLRAAIIAEIMCYLEVDVAEICQKFGASPNTFAAELQELAPYAGQGFLEVRGSVVRIFPEAKPLTRLFASVFDEYLKQPSAAPRHARAI